MTEFMSDIDGDKEDNPTGTIKILEDLDKDGVMDHSKVFLDSLVLPRALAFAYGGLLYAEPPKLWFVEIENDKPKNRFLVDSLYAAEGNPEHQPNGLKMNVDNWIYNAKSHFRYQRKNGEWIKEPTLFRGQWGISQDNFGRLYYNDNTRQLIGDYMLPNRLIRNKNHIPKSGISELLTNDQRVYPLHAAAVNRGYEKGILDQDSLLVNVTAACGPLVYRGGTFPNDYNQNVFVCVPEANLIKRNILSFKGDSVLANQAWQGKEFLAAVDEGFRPVSLSNGPNGSLYIVDMHRGVLGHHAYLSPYLRKKAKEMQLDTIVNYGRILKVDDLNMIPSKIPDWESLSGSELVVLLKHSNGWIRDRAQHYLVYKQQKGAVPELEQLTIDNQNPITQIHALHTLNGLDALSYDLLKAVVDKSEADVTSHAIVLLEEFASVDRASDTSALFNNLMSRNELSIDLYLANTIGTWVSVSKDPFMTILINLEKKHGDNPIFQEAILSGMGEVPNKVLVVMKDQENTLEKGIIKILEQRQEKKINPIFLKKALTEDTRTKGAKLFRQICSSCHGMGGEGIQGMAPPLVHSEHIDEVKSLALIILHGLKGPVHVNGQLYELNHAMPGLGNNKALDDKDISDIISYVSNAFSDRPKGIRPARIQELRNEKPSMGTEYTEEELLQRSK
jgi:mono/diheme cytochrome c family protein